MSNPYNSATERASILGPTLYFKGDLTAEEDLLIQGRVEGSITHTQRLTVGAQGTVKANIRAQLIIVEGTVDGDLQAEKSVFVKETAKVCGNIYCAHRQHHRRRQFQRQHRHGRQEGRSAVRQDIDPVHPAGQSLRQRRLTMSWFKKPLDGDDLMMNSNSSGRAGAPEPSTTRPEPREPRLEPRMRTTSPQPRAASRAHPKPRAPEAAPRASVLGPTLRFRGELSAQEDLIVQGSVEGSITHTQSLTVGTDGTMKGDIRARVIVIDGKVEGDLYATESVNIRATAKVKGNVFAPRVGISEGAFFQGQIEMQPSGAAVQEHSARLRQAALTPAMEPAAVDQMLGGT